LGESIVSLSLSRNFVFNRAAMNSRKVLLSLLSFALTCAITSSAQTASSPETLPVVREALKPSPIDANLRKLTDEVGGRVPGTPAMQQAIDWGVASFKAAGADSVTVEPFEMPMAWTEGATRLDVIGAGKFRARANSIAWSPGTSGSLKASVVDVGEGTPEEFAKAGNIGGRVVLVHSGVLNTLEDLFGEYLRAPPIIDRAVKGKAAAIAWISSREHDIMYRHINTFSGKADKIAQVLVAREDGERIARLASTGPVQVELVMPNKLGGPIKTANVVAEIKGSELPNEQVILGAHLDSWELGTGALDNGCNAALVIDTLRAIKAAGIKPKRTIRFVLFSGEEQGMFGSHAYTQRHQSELDQVLAEIVFDEGTGKTTGFSLGGRKDIADKVSEIMAPFASWGANTHTADAFVGTDNFDFLLEGVPNLTANQEGANYLVNYHASSDTYDKVDMPQLKKHVAIAAHVVTAIANGPGRLGPRQTREEIEQLMRETKLDEQLKTFSLWDQWVKGEIGRSK
jgi:carboxypeptidase Q